MQFLMCSTTFAEPFENYRAPVADIAVIAPVLGRPANAAPLAESLAASTDRARLVFVCSPEDQEQRHACAAATRGPRHLTMGVEWRAGPGDYARKINAAYAATSEPLVLLAADDLRFRPGWLEAVEAVAEEFDAGVIGTNDGANPLVLKGLHATHPVVRRCYIDNLGGVVGRPGQVYFEGYDHNMVDVELVQTALARGCYAHAFDAHVTHLHPLWRSAPMDATYLKGRTKVRRDQLLYRSRAPLWEREAVEA